MDALKSAWAALRASASIFAQQAVHDLEAAFTAKLTELETRLAAAESKASLALAAVTPAPPSDKPSA